MIEFLKFPSIRIFQPQESLIKYPCFYPHCRLSMEPLELIGGLLLLDLFQIFLLIYIFIKTVREILEFGGV